MDFTIQYYDVFPTIMYIVWGIIYEYTQKKQFVKLFGDLQLFKKNSIKKIMQWIIFSVILYIISRISIVLTACIFGSISYELLFHNDGEPGYFFGIGDEKEISNASIKEHITNISRLFIPFIPLWILLIITMIIVRKQKTFVVLILIAMYFLYFENIKEALFRSGLFNLL
ncbi:hypothetical protein [Tannockella kyphosi]|uniref:hypothetical protein n=1 Tax=Tannockella kyphosi TaxID=2899121 RepID=UPI0020126076|nr:hypothetical protein [Tannockella kyphosi]